MHGRLRRFVFVLFLFAVALPHAAGAAETPIAAARILVGEQAGAAWRIDVPANWNGNLIVFFRGNSPQAERFDDKPYTAGGRSVMLQRGFALAQSGYARADWNIADAYRDNEWVRRHFITTVGKPRHTYALGQSMGGLGVAHALEQSDTPYDGGLSLAGTLGGGDALFAQAFANVAAFDYYVPDVIGPLVPVPVSQALDAAAVRQLDAALKARPEALKPLATLLAVAPERVAEQTAINRDLVRRAQRLSGGNPVGNANHLYSGSGDDVALNAGVRRYVADAKAYDFLRRNYVPTGRLGKPLLALQTVRDPIVDAASTNSYATAVQRAGRSEHFVQQYTPGDGHLAFSVEQIVAGIDALIAWVEQGKRPPAGMQPGAVAMPAAAKTAPPHERFDRYSAAIEKLSKP